MSRMKTLTVFRYLAVGYVLVYLTACQSIPSDAFRLDESALAVREIQTREYDDVTDREILLAVSGVLQDLGYAIDEVERPLGVLSASKRANATRIGVTAALIAFDAATCVASFLFLCDNDNFKSGDDEQDIRLTAVVHPSPRQEQTHTVRVTIQRVVWDHGGRISKRETVLQPAIYEDFFEKLTKSVFLEGAGV